VSGELYKKYRPQKLSSILGQSAGVSQLKGWLENKKMPHALMFTGPSGVGKTTAARIIAKRMGCHPRERIEMNAADCRGIDEVRHIERTMRTAPLGGPCRTYILDECHQLTNQAQDSLLKPLEDTPDHVYFILCSSKPQKLIEAIWTRVHEVKFKKVSAALLRKLLEQVMIAEERGVDDEVADKIVEAADGSARKALVILEQTLTVKDPAEQMEIIESASAEAASKNLCTLLLNPRVQWAEVAKFLRKCEDDPEGLRRMVLGYASKVCLGGGKNAGRANMILSYFRDSFFEGGRGALINSCFEVVHTK
jgi:DNA polymerase III gamma/tau subunit